MRGPCANCGRALRVSGSTYCSECRNSIGKRAESRDAERRRFTIEIKRTSGYTDITRSEAVSLKASAAARPRPRLPGSAPIGRRWKVMHLAS